MFERNLVWRRRWIGPTENIPWLTQPKQSVALLFHLGSLVLDLLTAFLMLVPMLDVRVVRMVAARPDDELNRRARHEFRLLGFLAARMHRLVVAAVEKTYQKYPSDQETHRTWMSTESLGHLGMFVLGGEESRPYKCRPNRGSRDRTGD